MRLVLAFLFRTVIHPLVSVGFTYLTGMVFVRISRRLRQAYYRKHEAPDWQIVRLAGKVKMRVDSHSYMGGSIFWSGYHHLQEILYLHKRLKPGMTFIDVGANQGEFSLFAASRIKDGKVMSFEPNSKLRNLLLHNIQLNAFQNIQVFPYGLSNQPGSLPLYTSLSTDIHFGRHEGLSTLYPSATRNTFEETIELHVFDEQFPSFSKPVDFIKIDVEGAELSVLRGMEHLLSKDRPELLLEINEETFVSAGYTTADLIAFLTPFGYTPFKIKRGHLAAVGLEQLSAWGNYIFKAGK